MNKVKFGIVGCGRIVSKHLESITEIDSAQLIAVCDVDENKAKTIGEKYGVPYYTSYDDMISENEIDVVSVLTPSGLHAEHVIDIVKKFKKNIICEKPMALKLSDADEMIRVCDENAVRLFVVKQNRYNLPVQKLKEVLDEGRLGKLVLGTVRVRWARHQEYYDSADWRGTWQFDGGALTNQASHHIDLLEWMMGQPVEVSAMISTRLANIETEDTGIVLIKFENGALGVVEATTAARPINIEGSISILGEGGTVEIGGMAVNELKIWKFTKEQPEDKSIVRDFSENPPNIYGYGHKRYIENVIETLNTGKKALVDGLEGRKSLELINAIYESAETGKVVKLRFTPSKSRLGFKNE
ncbi:MAG: oxidoreductase [Firmicutes bacterium HGW-Firmicutes-12]|jgi:predicted dehydrogenase|nr:MAG: oxidoreductase [Firmicutes bacterium HGW-Firmicutes-12]